MVELPTVHRYLMVCDMTFLTCILSGVSLIADGEKFSNDVWNRVITTDSNSYEKVKTFEYLRANKM